MSTIKLFCLRCKDPADSRDLNMGSQIDLLKAIKLCLTSGTS